MNKNYDDIINYDYKGSLKRPKMRLEDRAKIFMPFAALKGYEELIKKTEEENLAKNIPATENIKI